jgi:hypothetical protein
VNRQWNISKESIELTDSNTPQISPAAGFSFPLTPTVILAVNLTLRRESPHTSHPNTRAIYTSFFPDWRTILCGEISVQGYSCNVQRQLTARYLFLLLLSFPLDFRFPSDIALGWVCAVLINQDSAL